MYCHGNPINFVDPDGHGRKEADEEAKKSTNQCQDKPAIDRKAYLKSYEKKLDDAKSKNQDKIVWTSPQRTSQEGYPEWAYTPNLENLYNYLMDASAYDIVEQIGEAYIKAIYDNPKDYGDGRIYQLPEKSLPKSSQKISNWKNHHYILSQIEQPLKFWQGGYIDNVHFIIEDGQIHWDPNNPIFNKGEFGAHCDFDYGRKQTPRPR